MSTLDTSTKRVVPAVQTLPSSIDTKSRRLRAVMTSNAVDRDGEIVEPSAFEDKIDRFLANPVLLWMHNPFEPPIGVVEAVEFLPERNPNRIEADIRFSEVTQRAQDIFALYAEGTLRTFSIGFIPEKIEFGENEETRQPDPPRIVKAELLELSAVTIPANPEAAAKMKALGLDLDAYWRLGLEQNGDGLDECLRMLEQAAGILEPNPCDKALESCHELQRLLEG